MTRRGPGIALECWAPLLLLAAGAGFIWLGIFRGELPVLFEKALRICLECIGIG